MKQKKIISGAIGFLGFILSPVSWWNDLVVNFPISYLIATPFGLISRNLFLPMFIVSYWATNILGLLLMHFGIAGVLKDTPKITRKELSKTILFCVIYSLAITILVQQGILNMPQDILSKIIK